jgi:hypothetical protein
MKMGELGSGGTDQVFFHRETCPKGFTRLHAIRMVTNTTRDSPNFGPVIPKQESTALEVTNKVPRPFLGESSITTHTLLQPVGHASARCDQQWYVGPSYTQVEHVSGVVRTIPRTE